MVTVDDVVVLVSVIVDRDVAKVLMVVVMVVVDLPTGGSYFKT